MQRDVDRCYLAIVVLLMLVLPLASPPGVLHAIKRPAGGNEWGAILSDLWVAAIAAIYSPASCSSRLDAEGAGDPVHAQAADRAEDR